eukprot:30687_1
MKNVFIFYAIIQLLLSSALSQGVECPDNYYGVDEGITLNECSDMGSGNYEKYWCQDENTVLVGFYKDAQCSPSTESWTAPYECTLEGDIHGLNAYPCKCDFNCADTQFESSWSNGGAMGTRTNTEAVVFNYNSKIFILGSWNNPKGLYECDITSSGLSCTDKGTNILNEDIRTYSQSYTQIGNLGYLLGDYVTAQTSLYVYTLSNNAPTLSKTITIPKNRAGNTACLTNTNDKLFVIGGQDKANLGTTYYHSPTFQIYNLPDGPWETSPYPKDLGTGRDACACVVAGDYVYALGGYSKLYAVNNNRDIETIERIQITNIVTNSWEYTTYDLKEGINSFRAIAIDHYIITIGGLKTNVATVTPAQSIQIINTIDNTIDYGGTFTTRSYANAVIHIGNMVYAFGGWDGNVNPVGILNTWQYLQLSTDSPTTNNPTTNNPTTFNPTTFNPTTFNPTTFNPTTTNPTTNNPTTTNPTTFNPTTTNPTTFNPTTNPSTNNPTTNNPTTTNPTTNNPTTNNPTTNNPTTTNPTTNNPTTNNPTLSPFTTS